MAAKIFLAHAREDKAQVRTLYADLKARGFDPWLDEEDLLPGQIWKEEIPKAIRQAGVLLGLPVQPIGRQGRLYPERVSPGSLGVRGAPARVDLPHSRSAR